jgi:hypothetical protein
MSFPLSFNLAVPGPTGAYWLDGPPDVTCKDSTGQHAMDDPLLSCNSAPTRGASSVPGPVIGIPCLPDL